MESQKFQLLPEPVKALVRKICQEQNQPPIDDRACDLLLEIGLQNACTVLRKIDDGQPIRKSFNGFIAYLVNNEYKSPVASVWSPSTNSPSTSLYKNSGVTLPSPQMNSASTCRWEDPPLNRQLLFEDETQQYLNPGFGRPASSDDLMKILSGLEFRKLFMVLSYIGTQNLASVMTLDGAKDILSSNHLLMPDFEDKIWKDYGRKYSKSSSRNQNYDWDRRKTHLYYYLHNDEGCYYKGPYLTNTRTHLQRSLGDDNVLVVKFSGKDESSMQKIAMEGIIVGDRHYKFFVFKDEREKVKNDQNGDNRVPKCYFVHVDLGRSITDARRLFMHVHTLKTIEKYMARFSLILSKTINLDLGDFKIDTIDDIPLRDENNCIMLDNDGEELIYTDGTGYISEDLAMKCPKDFASALYMKDNVMEGVLHHKRPRNNELPLLIQCRLFHNGLAAKGTLLLNKKLEKGTIQVRPSMIKVKRDARLPSEETFNSLEINSVSRRPGRSSLSKNLIALLSYGKVPQKFFLDLLTAELEDTRNIYSKRRTALKGSYWQNNFLSVVLLLYIFIVTPSILVSSN